MPFATIEEALAEIRAGNFVIVVDDEDRENEGDLIMAAEFITPAAVNFMEIHARGMLCVPMERERLRALDIPLMVTDNTERYRTAFTVTVDAKGITTTGISAADQAATIRKLADPHAHAEDFVRPGHVQPLMAEPGGVLHRSGHTEAAIDLARLAGLKPIATICEIKNPDGSMARLPDLEKFGADHSSKVMTIADLIQYRRRTEKLVRRLATTTLPTPFGTFTAHAYESVVDTNPYLALTLGDVTQDGTLVRVHSSCVTGDVFHSCRCDCGAQLELAMKMIQDAGRGVLLYVHQEGRGIGLLNKLRAYELQDGGHDTVEANELLGFPADLRDYGIGAQVLVDLGLKNIRLMTNNPKKLVGLQGYGLTIVEQVPLAVPPTEQNACYLRAKRDKLGHQLPVD
ncbi:MAG: bifunctional 3,4-dihydroxy-2-butanone-4-phosphate synthase/GTP cyclohydrolase II [Armatimonadota bacterium]|nr:MAG: bifunctional 3,4-dihydroxy-2-butanone-4-phosphate synthase/GTP cyclohydrolase II [Armatimonadota bacterium]